MTDLALKYNFSNRGTTFATHDVPGITRAAIPVFAKAGIKAINIGVDRASAVPATGPVCYNSSGGFAYTNDCVDFQSTGRPAFLWRDMASQSEMVTMVNPCKCGRSLCVATGSSGQWLHRRLREQGGRLARALAEQHRHGPLLLARAGAKLAPR